MSLKPRSVWPGDLAAPVALGLLDSGLCCSFASVGLTLQVNGVWANALLGAGVRWKKQL